jgi:hypothetical protein
VTHRQAAKRGGKRSDLTAAGVLLLVTVLFYWKILLTNQFSLLTGYEGVNQAYAWLSFWVRNIQQGAWPLWDPYTFSGRIFSGEMQTGSFYPLYLPLALFPLNRHGLLSPALYHAMYGAVHFLGAWFMFRLVRELELASFPAIVAGICFSLGGFLGQLPEWPHLLNSGIWLPLIFLFLLRAMKAPGMARMLLYASACGLCLGLSILAGGLHMAIMQAIVIATAAAFRTFPARADDAGRQPPIGWRQSALIVGVAGLTAFAAGAVQLLPSIEYSRQAWRYVNGPALQASEKIPYTYLTEKLSAQGILKLLIAVPRAETGAGEAITPYLGVFPLLLAAIGIWKKWRRRWVPYLTGLAIAAFAYSLGSASLLHGVLYALIPYLWLAREATRSVYLADFALAVLAAYGVDALFSAPRAEWEPLGRILKWLALAAMLALALSAMYTQLDLTPRISLSLALIVVSWLLFRCAVSGHTGAGARSLVVAAILFDLSAFDFTAANRMEISAKGANQMDRLLSCSGAVQFLKSREGLFRTDLAADLAPNIGDAFQIQSTGGSGVTTVAEYARFRSRADLLNVRYTIKPATALDAGPVYRDAAWKVYENPGAYPRAWLVHDAVVAGTLFEVVKRLDAPATDPHKVALLPARLDSPLDPAPETAGEQVVVTRYEATRMDLAVHAGGRALLVLSELYYPGWTAKVNGQPARIWKVDGFLRGIVVPRGGSRVSLQYWPASIYIGAALTLAAFAAPICLWFPCGARTRACRVPTHGDAVTPKPA